MFDPRSFFDLINIWMVNAPRRSKVLGSVGSLSPIEGTSERAWSSQIQVQRNRHKGCFTLSMQQFVVRSSWGIISLG